jgi:glycosyltransferase involved in cell wall biosynthesis
MHRGEKVAVVMPIHNEQFHLEHAISRVPGFVDLIIAVDDGSTDQTWNRLSAIENPKLVRLRHSRNRGVGAATKTGYAHALKTDVDLIAVMDGDGQMDGRDLRNLIEMACEGIDYVKGNRFLHPASLSRMPLTRLIGNTLLSWLTRRASGFQKTIDAQCGFTVIRRSALKRLEIETLYNRYGFPNDMFFAAHRAGLVVQSTPVRTVYADEVSGINPVTAIPAILFLIGRSYLRRRLTLNSSPAVLALLDGERSSAK